MPNEKKWPVAPLLGVIILAGAFIFYFFIAFVGTLPRLSLTSSGEIVESSDPLISTTVQPTVPTKPVARLNNYRLGDANAPIRIFEFSDFSCSYCKAMASMLKQTVARNPDVQVIWKDFPVTSLHPNAVHAHVAARCAGDQGKFWEYNDGLFANQGKPIDEVANTLALQLKLDVPRFTECFNKQTPSSDIAEDIAEGNALNIDGTPYLFIGDQRISGLLTEEELEQVLTLHRELVKK